MDVAPATRAKLRRLLVTLDELNGLTWREGPFTVLGRFLECTGQIPDLLALDTLEAKRTFATIASLLRFASDWQAERPRRSLADFVDYLDAYQDAGGELPTSVELADDAGGVRLMTLYQAKGLEYPYVFIPCLLKDEWPARQMGGALFPTYLLREVVPAGDIHTEEERRLLYVAMTRARERLTLLTHAGPTVAKDPSPFVAELLEDAGAELATVDRAAVRAPDDAAETDPDAVPGVPGDADVVEPPAEVLETMMALPSRRERRLGLRRRAVELIDLLEGIDPADAGAPAARQALVAELAMVGEACVRSAVEAREAGLDPLTLHTLAVDPTAGSNLLSILPLPASFSYTQFDKYERCPLGYALANLYGIPTAEKGAARSYGLAAHDVFELFTRERRERGARGEQPPSRDDLGRLMTASWHPEDFPDRTAEDTYRRRVGTLLDNFWAGEQDRGGTTLHEELPFRLALDPGDGSPVAFVGGKIDRIDRLPSGGIEVIDYKTGNAGTQKSVSTFMRRSTRAAGIPETYLSRLERQFTTLLSLALVGRHVELARDVSHEYGFEVSFPGGCSHAFHITRPRRGQPQLRLPLVREASAEA